MSLWDPLDRLGYQISIRWTPLWQVRIGVGLTIGTLLLIPYGFISGEPLLIYLMSAIALLIGGIGIMVTAVLALKEDPTSTEDDLNPDT